MARPTRGGHKQQPGPERLKARPCACPALLPVARKDRQVGDCQEFLSKVPSIISLKFHSAEHGL